MFGFKKIKTSGTVFVDDKRSINLDEVPVFYMEQDLEIIRKGQLNTNQSSAENYSQIIQNQNKSVPNVPPTTTPRDESAPAVAEPSSEKWKSSPFLNSETTKIPNNSQPFPPATATSGDAQPNSIRNFIPGNIYPTSNNTEPAENQPIQCQIAQNQNTNLRQTQPKPENPKLNQKDISEENKAISATVSHSTTIVKPSFKDIQGTANSHGNVAANTAVPNKNLPKEKNNLVRPLSQELSAKEPAWGKLLFSAIIVFIILIFTALGYYFWLTKYSNTSDSESLNSSNKNGQTDNISFLSGKPNDITIDIDNLDKYQIKDIIKKYANEVSSSGLKDTIEFTPKDSQNDPIKFEIFSDKTEIKIPAPILYNLKSDFSLFIYNDNGKAHLGLNVASKDDAKIRDLIPEEEMNIANNVAFLYFDSGVKPEGANFNPTSYGGADIRYLNMNSSENLSLDYTIFKNHLLIGTSKMTLRSMIDYYNNQSLPSESEDIIN